MIYQVSSIVCEEAANNGFHVLPQRRQLPKLTQADKPNLPSLNQ